MCEDCRVQGLARKREQFMEPRQTARPLTQRQTYPSKSRKVWRDRYEAAKKGLMWHVAVYKDRLDRGRKHDYFSRPISRSDWAAQKYRKARADAKAHGAI